MSTLDISVSHKIWFNLNKDNKTIPFIGEMKIELLKEISKTKSIKDAAKNLSLDFKKSWDMIENIHQKIKPHKLVTSSRGRYGGTKLTFLGNMIIQEFDKVNKQIEKIMEEVNSKFNDQSFDIEFDE